MLTLGEIARLCGAELRGDPGLEIHGVQSLTDAVEGQLSFLNSRKYRSQLASTSASAVILQEADAETCPCAALVTDNPYLAYARAARALHPESVPAAGIHPSAVIDPGADIAAGASIGPNVTIGPRVTVGEGAIVGPGCTILEDCAIGPRSRLVANVSIGPRVRMGADCLVNPGAVIGSRGFGLANDDGRWEEVPQVGGVVMGDRVEVGACTTIDRGAIHDTVIHDGVKLDNHIMIAHNVEVGENTAMAALVGIAGSTTIGANCTLGGFVAIAGHIEIVDNVHIAAGSGISRGLRESGAYAGGIPSLPYNDWRRNYSRIRQLNDMYKRIVALEKKQVQDDAANENDAD